MNAMINPIFKEQWILYPIYVNGGAYSLQEKKLVVIILKHNMP